MVSAASMVEIDLRVNAKIALPGTPVYDLRAGFVRVPENVADYLVRQGLARRIAPAPAKAPVVPRAAGEKSPQPLGAGGVSVELETSPTGAAEAVDAAPSTGRRGAASKPRSKRRKG